MKPLWCIRHQFSAPLGVIAGVLDASRTDWRYIDPWRGESLPDLSSTGGLIVLGGEMNADAVADHPWLADTRALLRQAVDAGVPVLGVCLGAQLLARALDAPVRPAPVREIGFRKIDVTPQGAADPLLSAFAPSALVFQFHEDTCALPASAQLLATGDDIEVQAFRAGERAYGVQFHFEVTLREVTAWCDDTGPDVLRDEWGTTRQAVVAEAAAHLDTQQAAGRRLAAAFTDRLQ